MVKIPISCRINPYNHDMVRAVADTIYNGDFSKALDFILYAFRTKTFYSKILQLIQFKADFDAGIRTGPVLDGVRQLQALLQEIEDRSS